MIDITTALDLIQQHKVDFGTEKIPLAQSVNRVLKENWYTDRDLPPYDRVTMDGIGIQYASFEQGIRTFPIEGTAAAGMALQALQKGEHCLEVMTGAILPSNLDTVIRYEDVAIEDGIATILVDKIKKQQNVHFKGSDRKAKKIVVRKNTRISPAEIGVGASVGKSEAKVAKLPKVIVLSTGDELVEINKQPLAHQVRRSNVYALLAILQQQGIQADEEHMQDDRAAIRSKLERYLNEYDAIIMSGGVSKGKFDFLPSVLEELGVKKIFHKVKQRPGKPMWFGQYQERCTVFGLPGNPVSSFVCMQRYFLTWLEFSLTGEVPTPAYAFLMEDVYFKANLTYFIPVQLRFSKQGRLLATPKRSNGSGDLANLVEANAFMELPSNKEMHYTGDFCPVYLYKKV